MKRFLGVAVVMLLGIAPALAEDMTPAKEADVRRMIVVTSGGDMASQMSAATSRQVFLNIKSMRPDFSDAGLPIIEKEMLALFKEKVDGPGGLASRLVPIYGQAFTHQEVRDILAFYQTPSGKKLTTTMPNVLGQAMAIVQEFSRVIEPDIQRRVTAALVKEKMLPAEAAAPAPVPAPAKKPAK